MKRRIAVSGASGLIGGALCRALEQQGAAVLRLVRRPTRSADEVFWDWRTDQLDASALEGLDAFVHLAGAGIGVRWNARSMQEMTQSRTRGTALIAERLAALDRRPGVFLSASAIGHYGDGRERHLDDSSPRGDGWMAELCAAWEAATLSASSSGIRVVTPRVGIVLSPGGGALKKMLPAFRFGLGGRLGDGRQGMSWIGLHDLIRILLFSLETAELSGGFAATAPNPVSNAEFTRVLGRVLSRPAFLAVPAFAISATFGEMGRRLLLDGDFVRPTRLEHLGFRFEYPQLEGALRHELDRP